MSLQKESEDTCNVLRCFKCLIYVCPLCGMKLDSTKFSMKDAAHILAIQHFINGPFKCRNHLWRPRKKWLKK